MFGVPRDDTTLPHPNDAGPNYFAYYKHLVLDLLSENGNCFEPFVGADSVVSVGNCSDGEAKGNCNDEKGRKLNCFRGTGSYFTESIGEGLSEFKKERLLPTLRESAACFNKEADEMLDHILATFQIDSNLKEKEKLPGDPKFSFDEDLRMDHKRKKRKADSHNSNYSGSDSIFVTQVYDNIQGFKGMDGISHEDIEKYTFQLLAKLENMEENLEEYMNGVVSKCRPMTCIEKHRLGKMVRKLPEKALDRVVEILQPGKFSGKDLPESISVDLAKEDNIKLWRLYYYVELVLKENKI